MNSSPNRSGIDTAHAEQLLSALHALAERFSCLAQKVLASVVEPLQQGKLPDQSVADECRSIFGEYSAVESRAVVLDLPTGHGLGAMVSALQDQLKSDQWVGFCAQAVQLLESVILLAHTSGSSPQYLIDAQTRAAELKAGIRAIDAGAEWEQWEQRLKPFRDLWRLLTGVEMLSEVDAEAALTQVEQAFGRAMMSALMTRKLEVAPQSSTKQEVVHDCLRQSAEVQCDKVGSSYITVVPAPTVGTAVAGDDVSVSLVESSPAVHDEVTTPVPVAPRIEPATVTQQVPGEESHSDRPIRTDSTLIQPVLSYDRTAESASPGQPVAVAITSQPTEPRMGSDGATVHAIVWELLKSGRASVAYHIADCWFSLGESDPVETPSLFKAAALAPFVRFSFGEVVDEFRGCVAELGTAAGQAGAADEITTAQRLILFGLALRPTLLAPMTGATSVLQSLAMLDGPFPAIGQIRHAVAGFGAANIELSPSVLKGVRDHVQWADQLNRLREVAREWLLSNRTSKIRYAPATEVWHRWLRDDEQLGRTLNLVIQNHRVSSAEVAEVTRAWSDVKRIERVLHDTDRKIRGAGARRKPIDGPPVVEICDRVQDFVRLSSDWLSHIQNEPDTLDDFRQRRADNVREEVSRALPGALAEIDRVATEGTAFLVTSAAFVKRSLHDLQQLFDPKHSESTETLPVRILLGEELLAVPDLNLTEEWRPNGPTNPDRLRRLIALRKRAYDPESAFQTHTERRNHSRTGQVIEALVARGRQALADKLQNERGEELRLCRKAFQQMLAATRSNIEHAVCYDLIGSDERSRFAETVEGYGAGLDEVFDFAAASADLNRIDGELADRRASRVEQVKRKLDTLMRDGVPGDRQADIDVIRTTLDGGDFLSAEEYLELFHSGQPLTLTDSEHEVFRDFFVGSVGRQGFARRFDDFMNSTPRPNVRDMLDRIRRADSVGPIDMKGVSEPQAREAAVMIEAWLRLKDMKDRSAKATQELTTLLTAFGFEEVVVESITAAKHPHWLAVCRTTELSNPADCIIPQYGSLARGNYRVLGVYDRPNEESLIELTKDLPGTAPLIVLYFGRMTEQRRRDLAEFSRSRGRGFITIDELLAYFLCGERFSRLPILFQCALPFTLAKPYTTTASLVPIEMFFGRQQEREQVTAVDGTNLVYGGRQLGKSALLRDIERRTHNSAAGQIVRWIDLRNCGIGINRPTKDIWAEIGHVLHQEGVMRGAATNHETVALRVREWLRTDNGRRILLLLDEADGFFEMDSKAPVEGGQSYPEVARLKGLMDDTDRRFKVVFAGLHNVQRAARDPNTPLGHLGTPVCIGPLLEKGEWKQARALIETPLRHMGYKLDPPDLWMRILSYTNYYPSLIQVFCKHLLEHLQNKDQTTFNFRQCPPYPVTAEQVERVYQSRPLREEVSHKFELTLGLDPRYRLIALRIALDSLEHPSDRADGVDVGWVRTQALDYWAAGFGTDDRSYESFRTILDEMVGLGILRRAGDDRYALRSPNVLNLLGSKGQIESKLEDVMARPPAPVYVAAAFRRSLGGKIWDRSPLTAEQEATLAEACNGVVVLFASRLAGLDRIADGLRAIPNLAGVEVAERMTHLVQFETWLRKVDEERGPQGEGVTLAVIDTGSSWSSNWVRRTGELLDKKKSSRKRFLRVVFIADPATGWVWEADEDRKALGVTEISLRPWHEAALGRWAAEAEFVDPHQVCEAIRSRLGGWYSLVVEFARTCQDKPHDWQAALDAVIAQWPAEAKWDRSCDIPDVARGTLTEMADYRDAIQPGELEELVEKASVRRIIEWADRYAYIQRADNENGERWVIDPVVGGYVTGGGR